MARIVFISICDRNAHGLRMMSAMLRRHGHQCSMIFLKRYGRSDAVEAEPDDYPWLGIDSRGREFRYAHGAPITDRELELLRGVLERVRPDAIGMSVTTPLRKRNARVTRFVKSFLPVPVIWGGYDPTVNTEACLEHCDYACVGEGDLAIVEIARRIDAGLDLDTVENLSYRRDGKTVTIPKGALVHDLDTLPWRDNDTDDKYFIEEDRLEEYYPDLTDRPAGIYQTITARGCPYRCTYCCEASLKDIYSGEKFLRRRSPRDAVAELAEAKRLHGATEILFEDEIFGMDYKWLAQFTPLYKKEVGLPFSAYLYPTRNVDRLLPLLKEAGLKSCCVSLQSGSERIHKDVFDRPYDRALFLKTIRLCRELGVDFYTDVITFNPYEEESDLEKTLDALLDIQGPYQLCINKLFVLPGTPLTNQMVRDGKAMENGSRDDLFTYYCRLFSIAAMSRFSGGLARWLHRSPFFRRHPKLIFMGLLDRAFGVLNTLHPREVLRQQMAQPPAVAVAAAAADSSARAEELVVLK